MGHHVKHPHSRSIQQHFSIPTEDRAEHSVSTYETLASM